MPYTTIPNSEQQKTPAATGPGSHTVIDVQYALNKCQIMFRTVVKTKQKVAHVRTSEVRADTTSGSVAEQSRKRGGAAVAETPWHLGGVSRSEWRRG